MRQMAVLLNLVTLLIAVRCGNAQRPGCSIDYEFKSNFYNCINILATREAGLASDMSAYTAYYCLRALSGHAGNIVMDSDTPLSYEYSDTVNYFCQDLKNWIAWYEKNKCEITNSEAEVLLGEEKLSWPSDMTFGECEIHIVPNEEMHKYQDSLK